MKPEEWRNRRTFWRETTAPFALLVAFFCAAITFVWAIKEGHGFDELWSEMGGVTLDLIFIVGVLAIFEHRRSRQQDADRQREVIDDYKRWDHPEAHLRIAGAIRRLNRLGIFALDMVGTRLRKFNFAEQGIMKIDGSTFYDGLLGVDRDTSVHLIEVVFDRICCRGVTFSPCNPFGSFRDFGSDYAQFVDCSFNETVLCESKFDGAELSWTNIPPAEIGYVEDMGHGQSCWNQTHEGPFYLADLQQTSFKYCSFKNADFRNAHNIWAADFRGAKGLEGAFFDNDEIRAAVLAQAASDIEA